MVRSGGETRPVTAYPKEYVYENVGPDWEEQVKVFGYKRSSGLDLPLFVPVWSEPNESHEYFEGQKIPSPFDPLNLENLENLEDFLLQFMTNRWQKFLAKWFGFRFCLGYFKKVNHAKYDNWFLFWCGQCQRFTVNFKQGFDNRLDCQRCQDLFLSGPFSKFSN